MGKDDWWDQEIFSSCMKEDRVGTVNELMRKTLQEANCPINSLIYKFQTGNDRDLVKCFFKYMLSNFGPRNTILAAIHGALVIAAAETHVEFAKDIVSLFVATCIYGKNISIRESNGPFFTTISVIIDQHGSPYKELFQENFVSTFIYVFNDSSEEERKPLYILRNVWNEDSVKCGMNIFTTTKIQELDLKIKEIKEIETSLSVSESENVSKNVIPEPHNWHSVVLCEEWEKDQKICHLLKNLAEFFSDGFEKQSVLIIVKQQSTAMKLIKLLSEDTMPVVRSNVLSSKREIYCIRKTKPEYEMSFINVFVALESEPIVLILKMKNITRLVYYDYPSNTHMYIERNQNLKNVYTLFKPEDSQHANDLIKLLMKSKQKVPHWLKILHKEHSQIQMSASKTEDIDSLVDFIEGKTLGAIPKRKFKEKVPKCKKVKNKYNRKDENTISEILITPHKSEESLIGGSQFEQSKTVRIIDEAEVRRRLALNELRLENLCLEAKQDKLKITENLKSSTDEGCLRTTQSNSKEKNDKSPDNTSNLCKKMQEQKMELHHQLQQIDEKKTNINKREDDLIVKHSKEMAVVLNTKTDAENGMQNKCKKLTVINSEVIKTDEKLNDLKKLIMNLEETKTSLVSQMKPIEKEIELDGKKIKKLEKKQNYLEGLCEANIEKIRKEKESVALERISVQKQIESNNVYFEKFQNPDLKEKFETAIKTEKEPEYRPNEEMVDFLKTIIEQKEQALECPICFETAKIPIYMCSESHLICFTCKLKIKDCPVCRRKYPEELIRNRYAEEDAEKLIELYLKMDRINNRI